MRYHLITDTHFGHKKLIEWGRPEDFEARTLKSLKNLAREISERDNYTVDDVLIHLGDFCIGNDAKHHSVFMDIFEDLPIRLVLVKGNHDRKSVSWYYDHGWDFVCEAFDLQYLGTDIHFTHIPEKADQANILGRINIHGHLHDNEHRQIPYYREIYHKRLALEWEEYKPITLKTFINLEENKPFRPKPEPPTKKIPF